MKQKELIEILENYTPEDEVKISISVFAFSLDGDNICIAELLGNIDRVVVGGWPIIIESSIQTQIDIKPILI